MLKTLQEKQELGFDGLLNSELMFMLENIGNPDPKIRDNLIYSLFCGAFENDVLNQMQFKMIFCYSIKNISELQNNTDIQSVIKRSFLYLLLALVLKFENNRKSTYFGKLNDKEFN